MISISSALIAANTPPLLCAIRCRLSSSMLVITMAPSRAFKNPPFFNGTGPPSRVPTASTEMRWPGFSASRVSTRLNSRSLTPSLTSNTSPRVMPLFSNNSRASLKARSARVPCAGINPVSRSGSKARIVSTSLVNGVTVKASAAYTTSAVCPSWRRFRISAILWRARVKRLGFRSAASIERDKSSAMTSAVSF